MKSIKINSLHGTVVASPSKSESIRALAIACLSKKSTIIHNLSNSDDVKAALSCISSLGSDIKLLNDRIVITGKTNFVEKELNCQESGLCFRIFSVISSLFNTQIKILRTGSLKKRDMAELILNLNNIGINIIYNDLDNSIDILSPIESGNYSLKFHDSSQVLSGILIALTQVVGNSNLHLENLVSNDYIDLTIEYMNKFGLTIDNDDEHNIDIQGGQSINASSIHINGDWSGSAFLIVAAIIFGEIEISSLSLNTAQGDKIIVDTLKSIGAHIDVNKEKDTILAKKSITKPFEFNAINHPDLIMPLCLLGMHCEGTSIIHGVHRLINKESNRLNNLLSEFKKLNANIEFIDDQLLIKKSNLIGTRVSSFGDHRLAMTFAIASAMSENPIEIDDFECVNKSYPEFWEHLVNLGANIYE